MATRIELPAQLEAYIQYKIDSGLYSNGAEVIRDALRHMMQEDEESGKALRLREAVQAGFEQLAQGEGIEYRPGLMQQMKEQARAKAQQGQNPKAEVVA
jgi:putative addiction module CopG family antidote